MVVLNDDGTEDFTIDNDTLVSESVSIDERMCSGDTIKFGLCEGSSLEFQYFNHPNITDRQLKVFCDVEYGEENLYSIPMGFFTVKKCSRQASTGIIKVTAYNKLQSDYLDQKANQMLIDMFPSDKQLSVFDIRYFLLGEYKINEDRTALGVWIDPSPSSLTPIASIFTQLGSFKFNSLYGVKSPINACEFGVSDTNTSFEVCFISQQLPYSFGANCQIDARYGALLALEQNVVNYIKNLIDSSNLDRSGDDVIDYICSTVGFQKIIGVYNPSLPNRGYYSTIQWDYEEKHGITHTVIGRIADIQYLTTSSGMLYLITPDNLCKWENTISYPEIYPEGLIHHFGVQSRDFYNYYIDSSLTDTAQDDMPFLTFSDGTKYKYRFDDNTYALTVFKYNSIADADQVSQTPSTMPDFTLRELQSAVFETEAQFGKLDRVTDLFSGVELNHSRLLPQDTLYPSDSLYPYGSGESAFRSQYSKLWADEGNIHKWRYLIITYKGLDGEGNETDYTLQRTVNNDGTDNYNCSDNWIFRNLVWTAEQIGEYADAMVAKMRDITWFPFEMWCAGLPYLETGDEIEIPLGSETYTSYILQRQLKGIQNLQDTYINGTLDIF
jgi:hypothetical protein